MINDIREGDIVVARKDNGLHPHIRKYYMGELTVRKHEGRLCVCRNDDPRSMDSYSYLTDLDNFELSPQYTCLGGE